MATLLTARDLAKTYATHTLFTGVAISLVEGDRLGLIGPNGSGKSTLLKILAGLENSDDGQITRRRQLILAYVDQYDRFADGATPLSAVIDQLHARVANHRLDAPTRAVITLSKLGFDDPDQPVASLSGGWRKRLSIACAIADEPDVLMLDEPTNHLDLEGVLWLEQFVKQAAMAVVFITHDRVFLEGVAGRIIELSRAYPGGTLEVKGNYSQFIRRKDELLEAQATQQNALAGKVRRDTAWLRQGIKGRQTRNKSQVTDAQDRSDELRVIKTRNAAPKRTTTIDFQVTDRKTKKLLSIHRVSKSMGSKLLFDQLDLTLSPGMRLGLLGPNGSGKTTLLRLLCGELTPDTGTIKFAAELRIVSFTQHRDELNPTESLCQALCPVGDTVYYRDKPVHVAAWAGKFLFDPGKFNTSVGDLSGGEQARILIANLMLKPADVLILDEPTNDLDIPSLEVLEQALNEFSGAIVLVTHDRFMLTRLSTQLLALDGQGHAKTYVSYTQWQKDQAHRWAPTVKPLETNKAKVSASTKKLSYKLQRELDKMEDTIIDAEAQIEALEKQAADPCVIADHVRHAKVCDQLGQAHIRVRQFYDRWAQLESMQLE